MPQINPRTRRSDAVRAGIIGAIAVSTLTFLMSWLYLTRPGGGFGLINDFVEEAYPPLHLLHEGRVSAFLTAGPGYVGSLIIRAPFALAALALHADWEMLYCATAVPCILAAPALAWWLQTRVSWELGATSRLWLYLSPLTLLFVLNPAVLFDLELGHPEDILGGALVIASVVQAARGRACWSMLLVGLAIDNKTWALVAAPVSLAVLPRDRARAVIVLLATTLILYVPVTLFRGTGGGALSAGTGEIFKAPQLWWWFGWRSWPALHSHEILVGVAAVCGGAWWAFRGRRLPADVNRVREGLMLLALVLLLRGALDTWDNIYYQLPFLMTIYALELGRRPRYSLILTIILVAVTVPLHLYGGDIRAVAYQLFVVPMIFCFGLRAFAPDRWNALTRRVTQGLAHEFGRGPNRPTPVIPAKVPV